MLINIAFRNLFRNRKRSLITFIAVFMGVFLIVTANGFNQGLVWQLKDVLVRTDTGDLKITAQGYKIDNDNPGEYHLHNYQELEETLRKNGKVRAFSPRVTFTCTISNSWDELRISCIGVDPKMEERVFNRSRSMLAGEFLGLEEGGVVLGERVIELLNLEIGDYVTIIVRSPDEGINAYDLKIQGIIQTGNPLIDEGACFVTLSFAQDFLGIVGVTDIVVSVVPRFQSVIANNELLAFDSETINILTWEDYAGDYINLFLFRKKMLDLVTIMLLLMAAVGIMNTMLMAMMERKREIGNLMSMGMQRGEIMTLFMWEGLLIGLGGSIVGAVAGGIVVWLLEVYGIPLNLSDLGNVPIANKLYGYLDLGEIVIYFFLCTFISVLFTLYPAFKAVKLSPIEAIGKRG